MPAADAVLASAGRELAAPIAGRISPNHRCWLGLGLGLLILSLPGLLLAQEARGEASRQVQSKQPPAVVEPAKPPMTPQQKELHKRKVVAVTTMMIAGILSVLLILLLWMVWWSRRTHRLLREPLPAANRGDELWYLKAKSPHSPTPDPSPTEAPPAPPAD